MVWDIFIRIFHWSLVVLLAVEYISEDFLTLHSVVGYLIMLLIVMRVVWGFIGSPHARFSSFPFSLKKNQEYFKAILKNRPIAYKGHNPPGAIITLLFIFTITFVVVTGVITMATIHFEGLFVSQLLFIDDKTSEIIEELHDISSGILVLLIIIHVTGVLIATIQHRKNFIKSMFTGRK